MGSEIGAIKGSLIEPSVGSVLQDNINDNLKFKRKMHAWTEIRKRAN